MSAQRQRPTIPAKFSGECPRCGQRIDAGTSISRVNAYGWIHADEAGIDCRRPRSETDGDRATNTGQSDRASMSEDASELQRRLWDAEAQIAALMTVDTFALDRMSRLEELLRDMLAESQCASRAADIDSLLGTDDYRRVRNGMVYSHE